MTDVIELPQQLETAGAAVERPGLWARARALGSWVLDNCTSAFWPVPAETALVDESLAPAAAAELIATQRYARPAPNFRDQAADEARSNTFQYDNYIDNKYGEMTEHQGLVQLRNFLVRAANHKGTLGAVASGMLENLTFIGEKEFAEGVAGLAAYWKMQFTDNPALQVCLVNGISGQGGFKSDNYLRERILEHFTDDELRQYKGRLLVDHELLTAPAEDVRIVLLDDWVISGKQMYVAHSHLIKKLEGQYKDRVEVQLLTASEERLSTGVLSDAGRLPVTAYFLTHKTDGPVEYHENGGYVSGAHSRVDFDFEHLIKRMQPQRFGFRMASPALTYVHSAYFRACPQADRVRRLAG